MEDNKTKICKCCDEIFTLDNECDYLVNDPDSKRLHPGSVFCSQCAENVRTEIVENRKKENMEDDFEELQACFPCLRCSKSFSLDDERHSKKWYPNSTMCDKCYSEEAKEIEEDERWETINNEISNALYDLENEENLKGMLSEDNILKILKIAQKLN